jgi:hypothetical protein
MIKVDCLREKDVVIVVFFVIVCNHRFTYYFVYILPRYVHRLLTAGILTFLLLMALLASFESEEYLPTYKGCQIFLGTTYQNGKKITEGHNI